MRTEASWWQLTPNGRPKTQNREAAAKPLLTLSTNRDKGVAVSYREVVAAQSAALADECAAVAISMRPMASGILLVKAPGGGWNAANLSPP